MTQNELFEEMKRYFPGGGCAGHRVNHATGMPLYLDHADGAHLYDLDGNMYIDYHTGSAAITFGFNHPRLKKAYLAAAEKGFYMNHDSEETLTFAKLFTQLVPAVEKIRLVNSGSEATLAAIRLARAYTNRKLIVKMDGHFHGMHEMVWFNGGNGTDLDEYGETRSVKASTAGVAEGLNDYVKLIEFNNIEAVRHVFEKYRGQIAGIIMEPVNYDCGCVPSTPEYMHEVRRLCDEEGVVMIFDEVISGARFAPGSAQGYFGVQADVSCFAKAVANGFSLAVVGGKAEIMDMLNPVGPVIVSGTSSGNLPSVMVANECLRMMLEPEYFARIEEVEKKLIGGMNELFKKHGIPGHVRSQGARFAMYFGYDDPEIDYHLPETVKLYRDDWYHAFVDEALNQKLNFMYPGKSLFPRHCGFTIAHTDEDIATTLERMDTKVFPAVKKLV